MNRRLFLKSFTLLGAGFLAGCGSSGDYFTYKEGQELVLDRSAFTLLQSILPLETDELVIEGYDDSGQQMFQQATGDLWPTDDMVIKVPDGLFVVVITARVAGKSLAVLAASTTADPGAVDTVNGADIVDLTGFDGPPGLPGPRAHWGQQANKESQGPRDRQVAFRAQLGRRDPTKPDLQGLLVLPGRADPPGHFSSTVKKNHRSSLALMKTR